MGPLFFVHYKKGRPSEDQSIIDLLSAQQQSSFITFQNKLNNQLNQSRKETRNKMKFFVVFAVILGSACAQQFSATQSGNEIVITRSENENNGDGTFRWLSELNDGTKLEQSGYVKDGPDPEHAIQVIQGSFSYISPEGQQINLAYTADENGFRPVGDHLPNPQNVVPAAYTATTRPTQYKPRQPIQQFESNQQTQQYDINQPIQQTPQYQSNQPSQQYQSNQPSQQYQSNQPSQQYQSNQPSQQYQPRPVAPSQRNQQPRQYQPYQPTNQA